MVTKFVISDECYFLHHIEFFVEFVLNLEKYHAELCVGFTYMCIKINTVCAWTHILNLGNIKRRIVSVYWCIIACSFWNAFLNFGFCLCCFWNQLKANDTDTLEIVFQVEITILKFLIVLLLNNWICSILAMRSILLTQNIIPTSAITTILLRDN